MALTISKEVAIMGNRMIAFADIAFPSSYAYGGEALNVLSSFGMNSLDMALFEHKGGYTFSYEGGKVRVFAPAPPIRYEEKHVPASDAITLDYPAAFILNAARSGGNKKLRSTGVALASLGDDECCLVSQMAAGERTQIRVKDYDRLGGQGAFTGGSTGWTLGGTDVWTYGSNAVAKGGDGTDALSHDALAAVAGRKYRLTYTISSWSVGTCTPTLGGTAGTAVGADGTYTEEITATTTDGLSFAGTNTSRFTIDSITVHDLSEPVYVSYVTQAWKDVWDNLVQDETKTLATGANDLTSGNKILACMYIDQTTATAAALTMIDEDDTVASGEVDLKLNAATAQFTVHSGQNAKAVKTTYIKVPASGFLADRLFTNEGATKAGADPYTNTFDYPLLLWAYTGQVPVNGGTTLRLIDYAGTPGTGEAVLDWFGIGQRGGGAPATGTQIGTKDDVTVTGAGAWGRVDEIVTVPLEVCDGADLSSLTSVKAMFIGQ